MGITKARNWMVLLSVVAATLGCGKDPAEREKELRLQLAAATRLIENYKANKYDGVEDLEQWKTDLETQLQELKK